MVSPFDIQGDVKFHTYRKKKVLQPFLILPQSALYHLEERLATKAGVRRDNHTVYEIEQNGTTTYLWFHDLQVHFGHEMTDMYG